MLNFKPATKFFKEGGYVTPASNCNHMDEEVFVKEHIIGKEKKVWMKACIKCGRYKHDDGKYIWFYYKNGVPYLTRRKKVKEAKT